MVNRAEPSLSDAVEGALDWWREAGVDCDFDDEPINWIALPPQPEQAPKPVQAAERRASARQPETVAPPFGLAETATWPRDLESFTAWWLAEPALDEGRTQGRVPPRGQSGAELMIVVPEPEQEDRERLLSGPEGRLLDAMLPAMDIAAGAVYLASALPRHTPAADWESARDRKIGEVLRHHITLVAPKRLIVFGRNILPLIGHDPPQRSAVLRKFNHDGQDIPLLAARSLTALLERPRWKAELWSAWLEWTHREPSG